MPEMKRSVTIALLTCAFTAEAFAQDSAQGSSRKPAPRDETAVERQIKGTAGRDIRVLVLTNVRNNCTSGPLPSVRLVTPPANGKITMRRVRLNATNVRQCLSLEIPALVGIYRSAPEFEGDDSVTVEILPNEGAPQLRKITITVTKPEPAQSI
jgi:hypothetical protein